jgi:hypothetical protein
MEIPMSTVEASAPTAKKIPRVWDKKSIQELLEVSDYAVERAILAIYSRQTEGEKRGKSAEVYNSEGFGKYDVGFYSNCANTLLNRGLSPKQLAIARPGMKKYWRQLVEIANENELRKVKENQNAV